MIADDYRYPKRTTMEGWQEAADTAAREDGMYAGAVHSLAIAD
jgi:hypothetical protein